MPFFEKYEGVCHICEGRVYQEEVKECEQVGEDAISWFLQLKEPIVCLDCGFNHFFLRVWKNMDVTGEFKIVSQIKESTNEDKS